MKKLIQFGETVEGYEIPVLNEREIRAAAGILFVATYTSLLFILFNGNFIPVKYVITFFLLDLLVRVFISPRYSPALIIGRLIVRNQNPEYVGAAQKKFAWTIGIFLSAIMFTMFIIINAYSPITGIICLICLLFTFFEAAFGICLGCVFYKLFNKKKVQYCPGEICDVNSRQKIQETSVSQLLVLGLFFILLFLSSTFLLKQYSKAPRELFKTTKLK